MAESSRIILVVDDDAEDRLLLKDAFDELHYGETIHFEENGEKAVNYLQRCMQEHCIPQLVILDLNMPKLNGRETLSWIKSQPQLLNITVIIYSTSLNPIEKQECLSLGAHAYVVKPVSYKDSIAIAENFISLTSVINKKVIG